MYPIVKIMAVKWIVIIVINKVARRALKRMESS